MKNHIKNWYLWLLLSLVAMGCFGCGKSEPTKKLADIYDSAGQVYCNVNESKFGFDIALLTKEKVQSVSLVGLNGKNVTDERLKVVCFDNSLEVYRDFKYKGYFCSNWTFEFDLAGISDIEIDSMAISVDGERRVLQFEEPLRCTNNGEYSSVFNEELCALVFPVEFSSYMLSETGKIEYSFETVRDCVFKGLETAGGVRIVEPVYYVNDTITELKDGISLKEGDRLTARIAYRGEAANEYSYCVTELYVVYEIDGIKKQACFSQNFSPLSPMDEERNNLKRYIDYKLNEVEK